MRTIETKIYSFEELSEEAKQTAYSNNSDINTDYDWWEFELEELKEKLTENGFYESEIFFSGFYTQGDGACFDAKVDASKFAETSNEKRICKLINDGYLSSFEVIKCGLHYMYSHENTRGIDHDYTDYDNINEVIEQLIGKIETKRHALCKEIYKKLEESYDSLQSFEIVSDTLIANEYEFLADGTLY